MFAKEALDVTVLIDQLDASLTRSQYATIMSIIMDNFPEPWSVCPPVIEWPKPDPEVEEGVCRNPLKGRRTAQVRSPAGLERVVGLFGWREGCLMDRSTLESGWIFALSCHTCGFGSRH